MTSSRAPFHCRQKTLHACTRASVNLPITVDNEGARVFIYRISRRGGVRGRVHILIAKKMN